MGKVVGDKIEASSTMMVLSLLVNPSITELCQLDVLGIQEPTEKKSKEEIAAAAKDLFLQTVTVNIEGRYQVRLPWLDGHPTLPSNFSIAKKRLATTVRKLEKDNLIMPYNEVFREWESLKIIEQVKEDINYGHFLPHRPVLKEGSTTAIRPVFDASAQEAGSPSLN
ncbi:uncharacterized protein LOC108916146 [Anoplophora glabripennis]|uniref:uncharacterized protein LOC108916146 n=1 Tax=Anoplophora glabripennis TaxID=217634 RepID=UPI0008751E1A|nr:uncharacterized protein LOC108916146 [Anoplophora glabripennis]